MKYIPVSLGQTAESRFQIVRSLFKRFQPDQPVDVVRWAIFAPDDANFVYPEGIFDMQLTQPHAVNEYLQRDFEGVFEKEDLKLIDNGLDVQNDRFQVTHPNLFKKNGPVLTESEFEAGYPAARAKLELLAARFRTELSSREPHLYVLSEAPSAETLVELYETVAARVHHPFRFLVHTRSPDVHRRLVEFEGVDLFLANDRIDKPAAHQWEGDDREWDRAFAAYEFAEVLKPR